MKIKILLWLALCFLSTGFVFAQSTTMYLNFYQDLKDELWVSQSEESCIGKSYVFNANGPVLKACVQSNKLNTLSNTVDYLQQFLTNSWDFQNQSSKYVMHLLSDIDFDQVNVGTVAGSKSVSCKRNHIPLQVNKDFSEFDGNKFKISNLCYDYDLADEAKLKYIGFMDTLNNVKFHDVEFYVASFSVLDSRSSKTASSNYAPMGAVAGAIVNSEVYNVTLTDVTITSPIAGGVAGYAYTSTVRDISGDDDIVISNNIDMDAVSGQIGGIPKINGNTFRTKRYSAFVGGLVGIAYDLRMSNINIISKVYDASTGKKTTVGGLIGMLLMPSLDDSSIEKKVEFSNLNLKAKAENPKTYTKLSGGASMGGFIGDICSYMEEDRAVQSISILNSEFYGSILKSKGDTINAGGFLGNIKALKRASLVVSKSSSNLMLADTLNGSATHYNYYAGGFVGGSVSNLSTNQNDEKLFLSISDSKASGYIKLANKLGVTSGVNAYVGGLAGSASTPLAEDSFVGDESSMELHVAFNGSAAKKDTIAVGGIVGKLSSVPDNQQRFKTISFEDVEFNGSIYVEDRENNAYIGGILGYLSAYNNFGLSLKNVRVENASNAITFNESGTSWDVSGAQYIGGICGYCKSGIQMENAYVEGNVEVNGSFLTKDSLNLGGAVGSHYAVDKQPLDVTKFYFVGNLTAGEQTNQSNIGYLFGHLKVEGTSAVTRRILSTYHSGSDSYDGIGGIEGLSAHYVSGEGGWKNTMNLCDESTPSMNESNACWDVRYNVRNGASKSLNSNNNGTMVVADMKSSGFVKILNAPFATNDAWEFSSGKYPQLTLLETTFASSTPASPASSSSAVVSSSSVVESSSSEAVLSSAVVESSSSEAALSSAVVESSSSEAALSSAVVESSSSEAALSSAVVESSSSEAALSSAVVVSSSSEAALSYAVVVSSSSEAALSSAVVVSSSSEVVLPSSSSESIVSSSSSESIIPNSSSEAVVVKKPEVKSHRAQLSGNIAKISFALKMNSVSADVKVRVLSHGKVVREALALNGVSKALDTSAVLYDLAAGEYEYQIVIKNKTDEVKANGKFNIKGSVALINRWQPVSLADVEAADADLDEYHVIFWWDEAVSVGEYLQYCKYNSFKDADASQGVWYGSYDGKPLKRNPSVYKADAKITWNLENVYTGWNLVANPYSWNVDLSHVESEFLEIWAWNASEGQYVEPTEIQAYEAIWVKSSETRVMTFDAVPAFGDGKSRSSLARRNALARAVDGWVIEASLFDDNGKKDSWNSFGTNSVALSTDEPPSGMGDFVSLSIVDGRRALARSFKPAADEMEWNFALSASSDRKAYLKLDGVSEVNALGKKVYVTVDGTTREMKDGEAIVVTVGTKAKTAVVRVADKPKAKVEFALSDVRIAHSGNSVEVFFSATGGLAGAKAKVELMTLTGKVVSSGMATTSVGANQVTLGSAERGLYMLRIRSGSAVTAQKVLLK